jgi:predicted ArsR family transcriptional regulator
MVDFVKIFFYLLAMTQKAQKQSATTARTRRVLVHLLKQEGPLDAQTLAERLKVSAMAVRQHLYALHKEQLVTYDETARPRGRPVKRWRLTPPADRLFPEAYAELTLSLLTSLTEAFGQAGLERLLVIRSQHQVAAYRARMAGQEGLKQRLATLAALRTEEGYMAVVEPQADGTFLLLEKHCPICVAATACTSLCSMELAVFQDVLGPGGHIVRTEYIVAGASRCAYRISEAL